jgi:hypothetical protein
MTARPAPIRPLLKALRKRPPGGLLFAVYAPFGHDPILSGFPDGTPLPLAQQPLLTALKAVAALGVDVAALVDLVDDDSWLVEIPACAPEAMNVVSAWKQAMDRPQALAGFLRRAHQRFPCDHLVLALEGHGAGYLPEVDAGRITPASSSQGGGQAAEWRLGADDARPVDPGTGLPVLPTGGFVDLPVDSPEALPVTLPLSTWAVAEALRLARKAGVPKPVVVHFNNCFNMALEHLHSIAPHAGWATGYANYNFFTAGQTYPPVFQRLRDAGGATAGELAGWFADANQAVLAAAHNHPTVGGTVRLSRMTGIAQAVDGLALAMVGALRADRALHLPRIQQAVVTALQYDTDGNYALDVPDQATDLGSLAARLQAVYASGDVFDAAVLLTAALKGVWRYGDSGNPHMARDQYWDFRDPRIGIGILLPDPTRIGLADWRTPYYMAGIVDPTRPPALKAQIPFLADRPDGSRAPWPLFIEEYHRDVVFQGLLRIPPLTFPVYDAKAEPGNPERPDRPRDDPKQGC